MLLLDSEALSLLSHGTASGRARVRALVDEARRQEEMVATCAAVLAEVIRGRPADAAVFAAIRRDRVESRVVDAGVAVRAGALLGAVGAGSELAVDAFLIAVADLAGGALVASADLDDLRRLAAECGHVTVVQI